MMHTHLFAGFLIGMPCGQKQKIMLEVSFFTIKVTSSHGFMIMILDIVTNEGIFHKTIVL